MQTSETNHFWQFDTDFWFNKLSSSPDGLSKTAVDEIHRKRGLKVQTKSLFLKELTLFIQQFKSPLMLLLIGAVVLSTFLGDTSDVFIILFILLLSSLLSFFQERNAGQIVEKLQAMIAIKTRVIRDGIEQNSIASEIVAGDIIVLKAGDLLVADCLILNSNELHANEASLTGESYPSAKYAGKLPENTELSKRTNCLWEGSSIVSGTGIALVINTAEATVFGIISKSASTVIETHFEKGIKDFGFFLMKITLVLSVFILVINLINHKNPIESALFALALAVGMAPELLPAITTIAMSAGAKRMLSKKVIVKKLTSIQNLGEINLLCTDKTGTITEGKITIAAALNGLGEADEFVKELAYWNAYFETGYTNPIDDAIKKMNFSPKFKAIKFGEIPYDFIRKRICIGINTDSIKLIIVKGALTKILPICSTIRLSNGKIEAFEIHKPAIQAQFEDFGNRGLRSIGVCYKNTNLNIITKEAESDMIFAGFILLEDPVKLGITETIAELEKLGVYLKIISGDNKNVAQSIALKIGILNPIIMTGQELFSSSPEALKNLVKRTHIFAEVEPQQKEHIIQALRKTYTVAYMGDGINDVSAISAADVGISVENAVDVARESADFVLMEKDLSVIVDGIKEGRKTFANTLKYIYINTGSTFGNMFSVAIASLMLPFLPMLPKQILLTNFITDFPYLTIASDTVDTEQLAKPGKWNLKLIRTYMLVFGIHSSIFDVLTFLILFYFLKVDESDFQSAWFVESILTELFILFIIRTHKNFFKSKPGRMLFISSVFGLILTLTLPYFSFASQIGLSPLPFLNLGIMLIIVAAYIISADLLKVWFFKKHRKG